MGGAVSCCSPASDCQKTDYETDAEGRYWITTEGERIQVPPDKILQRADNPTGRGVACLRHYNGHPVVRCFVRASESYKVASPRPHGWAFFLFRAATEFAGKCGGQCRPTAALISG